MIEVKTEKFNMKCLFIFKFILFYFYSSRLWADLFIDKWFIMPKLLSSKI